MLAVTPARSKYLGIVAPHSGACQVQTPTERTLARQVITLWDEAPLYA